MPLSASAKELLADRDLTLEIESLRVAALQSRLLDRGQLQLLPSDETFNVSRMRRNLVLLNQAVQRLARSSPSDPDIQSTALFVARSYEQLAELQPADTARLRIVAAVHYELAGYQANAATMARMAFNIREAFFEPGDLSQEISAFLQRRFLRSAVYGREAENVAQAAAENVDTNLVSLASLKLTREALGSAASYFLAGQTHLLERCSEDLQTVHSALSEAGLVTDANLINGIRSLLPRLRGVSTWSVLGEFHRENALWDRYLKALGRGLAGAFALDLRSISELWPSQRFAVAEGVLDGASRVVRMPTSAGKTRIAEMVIVSSLANRLGSRALYVAPFNALSSEVEQGFNALFTDLGLSLSTLTGAFDISAVEEVAEQDDLLITTPEKLDQLLRSESGFLDEVDTVILDEGHIVGEEQRGPKYELAITRLMKRRPDARFISLSAVVPEETLSDFSEWLKADRSAISSSWRPTIQRMARLRWRDRRGDLVFARANEEIRDDNLLFTEPDEDETVVVSNVIHTEHITYQHPVTRRMRNPEFPEVGHRAQVAAAYAWRVVDQGPVLIYCQTPAGASAVCKALFNRREWAELRDEEVPRQLAYRRRRSALVAEEWLGATHDVTERLNYGIAIHHATLPEAVKNAIEEDFRDRELSVLAATGTLAQGVNLPVRTLIVHTTRRYDEELQASVPMRARDFWNIAGRVGRAGAETEGTVVFLDFNSNDTADFLRYIRARDSVEPVESAIYALLKSLVNNRISPSGVAQQLDPEMLALLVEENETTQTRDGIAGLMGQSLVSIQAAREARNPERMWQIMAETSSVIAGRVPQIELRKAYASTGLSTVTCVAISEHISEIRDQLESVLLGDDPSALLPMALEGLSRAREMAPRYALEVSHLELLDRWMQGDNVGDIAAQFDVDAVQLTGFIEDLFGYRLPWGISGYVQLAQHELGLSQLPRWVMALPALVRYGVPSEASAWAMALGVPSRLVALQISELYMRSTDSPSASGLRQWLARLDPDSLDVEVGLGPEGIQAATRAVLRAHGNSLLRAHYGGEPLFPLRVSLRLRSQRDRVEWSANARRADGMACVRDYRSSYRNAVILEAQGRPLARLPREAADIVALQLDAGGLIIALPVTASPDEYGYVTLELDDEHERAPKNSASERSN